MKKLLEFRLAKRAITDNVINIFILGALLSFLLLPSSARPGNSYRIALLVLVIGLPGIVTDVYKLTRRAVEQGERQYDFENVNKIGVHYNP